MRQANLTVEGMSTLIVVKAAYDPEARVWFVEDSDVPGLRAEGASLEALVDKLPAIIVDLREDDAPEGEVAVEVIAHARTRVPAAA